MNRAQLHAEAIRIQQAMYDAPLGEEVTVLYAALLNLVPAADHPAPTETGLDCAYVGEPDAAPHVFGEHSRCINCGAERMAEPAPQGATCLHEWREQASGLNYCYKCGSWRGSEVVRRS